MPEINLRASTIKIYWNITAGASTIPVEIPNVEKFHFAADNSIVFTLKNGNTVEMADYKGVEFAIEPAKPATNFYPDFLAKKLSYKYHTETYSYILVHFSVSIALSNSLQDFLLSNFRKRANPEAILYKL